MAPPVNRAPSWQPGADSEPGGAGRGGGGGKTEEEEEEWWRRRSRGGGGRMAEDEEERWRRRKSGGAKLEKCSAMQRRAHGKLGAFTYGKRPPILG